MVSNLTVKIGADIEGLQKELNKATGQLQGFSRGLTKIGGLLAGAFAVDQLLDFGKEVFNTTAEFQKFEAVLTNTLGSNSAAKKALDDITKFAASTPFQVNELTDSFVKLANSGFKPTLDQMRSLGDLAASQGKSFNQLTEAIIDAQTGEFERLKEFGIRASKEGDKVTFTFKGVKQQVDFTADSIRDYILSLGDAKGVSGGMEAISKTLGGQFSNLQDAVDQLELALGQAAEQGGAVSSALNLVTESVQLLTSIVKSEDVNSFFKDIFNQVTGPAQLFIALMKSAGKELENIKAARRAEEIRKLRDELAMAEIDLRAWQDTGFGDRNKILQRIADISSKLEKFPTTEDPLPWATTDKATQTDKLAASLAKLKSTIDFNAPKDGFKEPEWMTWQPDELNLDAENPFINIGISDKDIESLNKGIDGIVGLSSEYEHFGDVVVDTKPKIESGIDIGPMVANAFTSLASALGEAAAGVGNFGQAFLESLGEFMQQFGAALIAAGIGKIAFDSFSGPGMLAGGALLVAAGAAIKSAISNRPNLSNGGSASSNKGSSPRNGFGGLGNDGFEIKIGGELVIDGDKLRYIINRNNQLGGRTRN